MSADNVACAVGHCCHNRDAFHSDCGVRCAKYSQHLNTVGLKRVRSLALCPLLALFNLKHSVHLDRAVDPAYERIRRQEANGTSK